MSKDIVVGMADLAIVTQPHKLSTIGLGSCVGICLYDKRNKVAGLAHAMLPDSTQIINNHNEAKFVDTATNKLISEMSKKGANKQNIVAKVVGGAQMFAYTSQNENMRIGDRNIEAAYSVLKKLGIPVLARDVGENYGRTVIFDSIDGSITIKTIGHGIKLL